MSRSTHSGVRNAQTESGQFEPNALLRFILWCTRCLSAAALLSLALTAVDSGHVLADPGVCGDDHYEVELDDGNGNTTCVNYWNPNECDQECRGLYWERYHTKRAYLNAQYEHTRSRFIAGNVPVSPRPPSRSCNPHSDVCIWQDTSGTFQTAHNHNYVGPSAWDRYVECMYHGGGGQWNGSIEENGGGYCSD